jgi:hypothetical protein
MRASPPVNAATAPKDAFVSPSGKGSRGLLPTPPSPLAMKSMMNSTSGDKLTSITSSGARESAAPIRGSSSMVRHGQDDHAASSGYKDERKWESLEEYAFHPPIAKATWPWRAGHPPLAEDIETKPEILAKVATEAGAL